MITAIGALILIFAIVMAVVINVVTVRKTSEVQTQDGYERTLPASPVLLRTWSLKKSFVVGLLGVATMFATSCFFYARPGHQYYIVAPTGQVSCQFDQGWKMVMPYSRIQEWESFTDIKSVSEGESIEGIEGPINGGIPIRFIDKVMADVRLSVRMQLPQDPTSFIALVEEFRHPKNLINNTLIPTVREQVINTGYMFTAEDYVSGDASNFRATLDEQLKNGG